MEDIADIVNCSYLLRRGGGNWGNHPNGEKVNNDRSRRRRQPAARMLPEDALKLLVGMSEEEVREVFEGPFQ